MLRIELRASGLSSEQFTNGAISPALKPILLKEIPFLVAQSPTAILCPYNLGILLITLLPQHLY